MPIEYGAAARAAGLIAVAEDLAGEFSLRPLLERILLRCTELLGCTAGSICSVDEAAGTYRKEADIGVACQSGQVFPLTEGMTGAVVAKRAPVWFDRYDQVRGGHVAAADRATLRGVIGVPLEWRGRIIGACVVFSRDERRVFGPDDAELLELFARHAAIALATARMHEVAEERARAEATAAERDRLLGEVHDSLAQRLVSIRVHLDSAEGDLGTLAAQAADAGGADLAEATDRLRQAGAEARDALAEARLTLLGGEGLHLHGRAARRSGQLLRDQDGGRRVRAGRRPGRTAADRQQGQLRHQDNGDGAHLVHAARQGLAAVRTRRRRDGDGRRHPRRARLAARSWPARTRSSTSCSRPWCPTCRSRRATTWRSW